MASETDCTQPGTVESRTISSGYPGALPNVCRRTSGPRLLPPIPSRTTCLKPACRTSATKASSSGSCSRIKSVTVSQPRRSAISVGSGFQTVWSPLQMRDMIRLRSRLANAEVISGRSNKLPLLWWRSLGHDARFIRCGAVNADAALQSENEVDRPRQEPPDKLPLADGNRAFLGEEPHQREEEPDSRGRNPQAAAALVLPENAHTSLPQQLPGDGLPLYL